MLPTQSDTLLAMAYLIGPGSIGVFLLALYVLARWTASATSYAFLLFPLVAIVLGALLFEEPVQPSFLLGGAVVLVGVYRRGDLSTEGSSRGPRAGRGDQRGRDPRLLLVGVRGDLRWRSALRLLALRPVELLLD